MDQAGGEDGAGTCPLQAQGRSLDSDSRPCLPPHSHQDWRSIINSLGTADRAPVPAGRGAVATAQVFGLSLLRVFLCLLVNSGLQGTRRATCVSPARGQYSKGRAEAVAARDTPSLSSAKMSQVKGHRESQIC